MPNYPPPVLDEIRAAVDIVDLVGRFVKLKKAGANWKGLCPFHAEKTPSFMVNPRKGIFHCFGCGVGGDAFGFLMRQDKLSFPEAVRALARTAGVTLPEERGGGAESGREELRRVLDLAAAFYAEALWKVGGERARQYLETRGVAADTARRFGLGLAPEGWRSLLEFMRGQGVGEEPLIATGLVVQRDDRTGVYDRFRGRLLFPIRDVQGRVVAFGGRAFGDEQPKYLNSPETPLYTKGNLLYAADLAREAIQTKNRALIVEGYVDCLMAHQHGFTETVAALGTAFTAAQLGILRRYTDEVVTFFDADAAGQKAAERAEELLEPTGAGAAWAVNRTGTFDGGFRVRVALLPPGHDPDTFLRAEGSDAFEARIRGARSLLAFALDRAVADPEGGTGPRARANAFARAALLLAKVGDAHEAASLSREAAARLGVDATQLWTESRRLQSALGRPQTPRPAAAPVSVPAVERDLAMLLLRDLDARRELLRLLDEQDLGHEPLRVIVAALKARPDAPAEALLADLPEGARNLLAALIVEEREADGDTRASIAQFRTRLERQHALRRMRAVSRGLAEGGLPSDTVPHDEFRTLTREGKWVLEVTRGVGSSHTTGSTGHQGVQTNE